MNKAPIKLVEKTMINKEIMAVEFVGKCDYVIRGELTTVYVDCPKEHCEYLIRIDSHTKIVTITKKIGRMSHSTMLCMATFTGFLTVSDCTKRKEMSFALEIVDGTYIENECGITLDTAYKIGDLSDSVFWFVIGSKP